MATVAGTVQSISGKFFAKDGNGNVRELTQGDKVYENDTVFGDKSNSTSQKIEVALGDNDAVSLNANQAQAFDASMIETAFGYEELYFPEQSVSFALRDGAMTDVVSDLRDAEFKNEQPTAIDEEGKDITEEETAEGDEEVKDETEGSGNFQARDGDATDIASDLRTASFKARTQVFEDKEVFKSESEERLSSNYEGTQYTNPFIPTPTIISQPTPVQIIAPLPEVPTPISSTPPPVTPPTPVEPPVTPPTPVEPPVTPPTPVEPPVTPPTPVEPPVEPPVAPPAPRTIIKIVAADALGNPLKDSTPAGNYLEVNETPEGGKAYYVALAFTPDSTVFNDTTKLATQEGTVDFTFTDGTAGSSDYTPQAGLTNVMLGTKIEAGAIDDYVADNGEIFTVTITNYTPAVGTAYGATTISSSAVTTTIKDNPSDINKPDTGAGDDNPDSPTYGPEDTVYAIITGPTDVNEGDSTTDYTLKLVDKDNNIVTVTKATKITVTYSNNNTTPTQDGDTQYSHGNTIEVTIPANDTTGTFSVATIDDPYKDDAEKFKLTITGIENTGEFENVKIGDKDGNYKNVITTIHDNTPTDQSVETNIDPVQIVLVAVSSSATTIADITNPDGTLNITNTNITSEGGKFYYIPVAVVDGKPLATQDGKVDLTYNNISTTDGDYVNTKVLTNIGEVFSVFANDTDLTGEPNENFTVTISNPTGTSYETPVVDDANKTVTSTIDGNVYVKIINDSVAIEGNDLTHTVILTDIHGNAITAKVPAGENITVTLQYSVNGTELATSTSDFKNPSTQYVENGAITVVIGAGNNSTTITNTTIDDFISDNNESYELTVTSVAQSHTSYVDVKIIESQKSVTGTILDGVILGTPLNASVDEDNFVITTPGSTISDTKLLNITAPNSDNAYKLLFDNNIGAKDPDTNSAISLTSNGKAISFDYTTEGKIIATRADDSKKVFEITLNKNGIGGANDSYTYTQYENIDHPDADIDDNIVLTFGYKIEDQGETSTVQNFTVTVNDSLPSAIDQTLNIDEDGSKVIIISAESFKDGKITLNNGVDGNQEIIKDGTINIYDADKNDVVGVLTNNGDGTVTFVPTSDYSGATAGFSYTGASDADGDTASASIAISVTPKSDAPTIANGGADTWEDTKITINLKAPVVKDATDKNEAGGTTVSDYPEKLGLISLHNMTTDVQILDGSDALLWTSTGTSSKLYILLSDGEHTADTISSFVIDANHITMTKAQFELLKVNPVAQSHNDIDIKMSVTEYEVDVSGNKLPDADVVGANGSETTKTFHVEVKAVTDDITLIFDGSKLDVADVISGDSKTYTITNHFTEGNNTIDLKTILSATSGAIVDLDKSENISYKFEGVPPGTVITLGTHTATANALGVATIWFKASDYIADPDLSMKLEEQFSGQVNATVTLSVKDTDSDSTHTPDTKTQVLYFNVHVDPVADIATLQLAQSIGFEDAGRSKGNTIDKDGTVDQPLNGIPLSIKVSSDDKDGSETFNVEISDIPANAEIYYDGNKLIPTAGSIIITNFENAKSLTFVPPHNSDADYVLKVNAQTVDGVDTSAWLTTPKDLQVTVLDKADVPVGTEFIALIDGEYVYKAVEADLDNNGNSFDLKDIYANSTALKSYDADSETLSIVISNLPSGFGVEGASPIGSGVWAFLADNIDNVKITTPTNFSGEASFNLKYVTTENAGDSKTHHTDTVKIFVSPSAEATINTTTTANEDVLQKVDFSIAHQNSDNNEVLEELRIKVSDVDSKEFTLYLGSAGTTALADAGLTTNAGYYILNATQANDIYVKNTATHKHGAYTFEVGYTVKDTETDKGTSNTIDGTISNYTLTINAVTDTPTATIGTIDDSDIHVSVAGTTVTVSQENATFTVPLKVTSPDQDASEDVTEYLISGVPMGVEVVGATYAGYAGSIHNGMWILNIADIAINDVNGHTQNIEFKVNQGANFENRDIKITAYTQDEDASVESASATIRIEKDYISTGPGTGTPPQFMLGEKPAIIYEDNKDGAVIYNLGKSLTVTNEGGSASGGYAVTITDFAAGTTVTGYSYSYIEGGVTRYVITGNGNAADVEAKLSLVTVTPPANVNDTNDTTKSMTFTATIATHHTGTFHQGNAINYEESVLPVTDNMTIAIATTDTDEDTAKNFSITLSNDADGSKTALVDSKVYITITESYEVGETELGHLVYGGETLTKNENNQYEITLPAGYSMGQVLNFTFHPGADRHGDVTINAVVKNFESEGWDGYTTEEKDSSATATIKVAPVVDGFKDDDVKDTTTNETTGTDLNIVQLDISALLSDPSEKMLSATLNKIPNGFVIYYGNDANSLSIATNTGTSGGTFIVNPNGDNVAVANNQWLIPLTAGKLPPHIWLQAPQNWSGKLEDIELNLFGVSDGGASMDKSYTLDVTFNAISDGLTIDPTLTFGNAFEWVDLKINANMVDIDGSETMSLEISGLDDMAQFRLADGTSVNATYESNTWKLSGIEYDQINNIQFAHDKSVASVSVTAKTIEQVGGDVSSTVTDTFELKLYDVVGSFKLDTDLSLDFSKIENITTLNNINTIDLREAGINKIEKLSLQDVLEMSNSSKEIEIKGIAEDEVSFKNEAGKTWSHVAGTGGDLGFDIYTNSGDNSVKVKVETAITDTII